MIKKEYMQPAMEVNELEAARMIADSVTTVNTNGLDDESLDKDNTPSNPWEIAW